MIVRILGEGQWTIDADALPGLNTFDDEVESALAADDQDLLSTALGDLLAQVRAVGEPLSDDVLAESDLILPDAGVSVEEMRDFLGAKGAEDGLIPG